MCCVQARRPLLFATLPTAFIKTAATSSQPAEINWRDLYTALVDLPGVSDMAASQDLQVRLPSMSDLVNLI